MEVPTWDSSTLTRLRSWQIFSVGKKQTWSTLDTCTTQTLPDMAAKSSTSMLSVVFSEIFLKAYWNIFLLDERPCVQVYIKIYLLQRSLWKKKRWVLLWRSVSICQGIETFLFKVTSTLLGLETDQKIWMIAFLKIMRSVSMKESWQGF